MHRGGFGRVALGSIGSATIKASGARGCLLSGAIVGNGHASGTAVGHADHRPARATTRGTAPSNCDPATTRGNGPIQRTAPANANANAPSNCTAPRAGNQPPAHANGRNQTTPTRANNHGIGGAGHLEVGAPTTIAKGSPIVRVATHDNQPKDPDHELDHTERMDRPHRKRNPP